MSGVDLKTGALLDQQLALSAYLEALLDGTPEPVPVESAPASPVVQQAPAPVPAPVATEATPVAASAPAPQTLVTPVVQANGRPAWAATEFQCLLFQVAGLTLAVPLSELNGVLPLDLDTVTPMPGHSALFLGLIDHLGQQVRVVDTAQVVLPPERLQASGTAAGRASHLVLIGEGRWGWPPAASAR
jgi:purine-binding chemotaxis protein CheW